MVTSVRKSERTELPRALLEVRPFSAVAIKALQVVSNEYGQLRELSELIISDAAFSGEILRIVNSPLFGIRKEVSGILQATLLLGLERVKGVVATIGMKAYLGDSLDVPALRACWRHSLACAVVAEEMARASLMEEDVAYTAGLMHDIGRLALAVAYPQKYAAFLMSTEKEPCDAVQYERELFGIDHCQAGRLLVLRWNLPKHYVGITSQHHEPAAGGNLDMLAIVRHSCRMADALGFNAVYPLQPQSYDEILACLPDRDRGRLPHEPSGLIFQIANKINSIESV
jgi:putative nucleotidyltransferase with HDIG domain